MNVTAIDTHAVVKRLMAAGFTDVQAEAVTLVVRDAQDIDLSNLATKVDLAATKADLQRNMGDLEKSMTQVKVGLEKSMAEVKADLEKSIAEVKADLEKSMAGVKVEILKWMVSTIGIQTVVIIGAVVTLVRTLH